MAKKDEIDMVEAWHLYADGATLAELGDRYGISGQYMGQLLRAAGQKTRVGGGQYDPAELDAANQRILKASKEGRSLADIAFGEGVMTPTIAERLKRLK